MKGIIFLGLCISPFSFAQQSVQDSMKTKDIQEVSLLKKLPVTKEIIHVKKDLEGKNLGQDLPILLKNQTSVETTSDAGNGIGYTGLKIRGVDGTRINIMLNGVPYNDSESQGSFFVNLPDITSSASTIAIQRGVGTSTNGVASFGGSVNIFLQNPSEKPYFSTQNSYGSYQSHKHSFELGSGNLFNEKFSLLAKYSIIKSDGYIDRAASDLESFNLTALYKNKNTKLRFLYFGGKEKTYQAWNGISKEQYETNPRYNASGEIYDSLKNIVGFYNNETDNYKQNNIQMLWEQQFNSNWKLNTTFHLTLGNGYYENYKSNQKFSKYGLPNLVIGGTTISKADMIRQKWLDNKFYGLVSELQGKFDNWDLQFGGIANQYYGEHFGKIVSGDFLKQAVLPWEYYRNHAVKNEISGYGKALYKINDWSIFGDLQVRNIQYQSIVDKASPEEAPVFDKTYTFFNPKLGVTYQSTVGNFYFSYANAHREPVRSDLQNNTNIKPEVLHDFELGFSPQLHRLELSANLYYMLYQDQLVLTGALDDVGAALHENIGKSYRTGVEITANYPLTEKWKLLLNTTISQNYNQNYYVETPSGMIQYGNTAIAFSPNFITNFTVNYSPIKNISFSIINKWVSKQYINNTQTEEYKLDPYFLSDFNFAYQNKFKNTEVGIYLLVNNILNKKYTNYGVDYGTPYYYAQARANFSIGINLKFF